jgi:ABC-type glycerol-3-phosphate transport system substrate-binding protein
MVDAPDARLRAVTPRIIPIEASEVASRSLLDVLDLLAHLLERGLGADDRGADLGGGRLGADRVELAADLLDEEVEPPADRTVAFDQRTRLVEVAGEPDQLLRDVGAIGEDRDLLRDPRVVDPVFVDQPLHAVVQPARELVRGIGREHGDLCARGDQLVEPRVEIRGERAALGVAHPIELRERRIERREHGRRGTVGIAAIVLATIRGDHPGLREDEREIGAGDREPLGELGQHAKRAVRGIAVDPQAGGAAGEVDRDRDCAAIERPADARGDRILDRRGQRGTAQLEIEEAMVHRAHIHGRAHAVALDDTAPVAGHAAHGLVISCRVRVRTILIGATALACACREPTAQPAIRFLHTFGSDETELFNAAMAERGIAVEPLLVPFARGRQVISEILAAGTDCPELIRIDATWLPGLVAAGLLVVPPPPLVALDWSAEAAALAQLRGTWWGLPQSLDGLIVIRDRATPAPASPSVTDLVAAATAARTATRRFPLSVRVDGYWFVPWLRSEGGELSAPGGIAGDGAIRAMARLAALFGNVTPPLPSSGREDADELGRWRAGEVAYWLTGPWQFAGLPDRGRVAVSALAGAPRGGQLLVVPRCAKHPDDGWRLAGELTSLAVEVRFAEAFAMVPTRSAAIGSAPALSRSVYEALRDAAMLPREPVTPLLFDDLNPALAAVVAGDATAEEAVVGVRRGWHRLIQQVAR